MACGCADRMRKHILPRTGYSYNVLLNRWDHDTESSINDEDIADHHTRLTAQIGLRVSRAYWARRRANNG